MISCGAGSCAGLPANNNCAITSWNYILTAEYYLFKTPRMKQSPLNKQQNRICFILVVLNTDFNMSVYIFVHSGVCTESNGQSDENRIVL